MSFVGSMLGGSSGSGFQAQGTNPQQIQTAYDQTQSGIKQQQDFVNALGQQNGLANQSSVFGQQQGLANQLQGVANGTGPNPAMAQLNQATGANISSQNALMAGQRGASANVGLMARQAAMQGANTQQQAVGQGATMQAQQSLAAMQQLQSQQANMGNLANTQVNQQQAGLTGLNQNALQQQSNLLGIQANQNSANAGIAQGNQGAQQNILGGVMNGIGSVGTMLGGAGSSSSSQAGLLSSTSGTAGSNVSDYTNLPDAFARGGQVRMAEGGQPEAFDPLMKTQSTDPTVKTLDQPNIQGPQSKVGQMFNTAGPTAPAKSGGGGGANPMAALGAIKDIYQVGKGIYDFVAPLVGGAVSGVGTMAGGAADSIGGAVSTGAPEALGDAAVVAAARGGRVPALVSPGEKRIHAKDVPKIAAGKKSPLDSETIPGKPKVGGSKNSYANDTVKKTLNEGDIILPRSVTQSKDPAQAAHKFVSAILAKNGKMPKRTK